MRISVDEARGFFADPSQQIHGITPDALPDVGFEYWASGPLCAVWHLAPWPNVWMGHFAAKPEGRGHLIGPGREILAEFWDEKQPARLIGWTPASNRAALAFTKRLGFVRDGVMPLPDGEIIIQGWSKWQ